ncbi:hypothetical protein N9X05_05870 [Paracoccaceae bacterium]|nr:hypothetical protein [Paracoccaceae bacterium]
MSLFDLMLRTLLSYLQKLAEQSLSLSGVPEDARMRLINVAENTTYLVDASQGNKAHSARPRRILSYIARHRK